MDALDTLILAEKAELERLRLRVAAQEATVAALVEAAALRPNASAKRILLSRGGKPKGAISSPWKNTLAQLYKTGRAWPYNQIKACYDHTNGADLALASVRDRVRSLVEGGLMVGNADDGFVVTDLAAKKFSFPKPEKAPDAVTSEAESSAGSVGRDGGYPPTNPEGSTPSDSTPVQTGGGFADDLDDDIPF